MNPAPTGVFVSFYTSPWHPCHPTTVGGIKGQIAPKTGQQRGRKRGKFAAFRAQNGGKGADGGDGGENSRREKGRARGIRVLGSGSGWGASWAAKSAKTILHR